MRVNHNFSNLEDSYLFSSIAKKVSDFQDKYPEKEIIKLGIGDVTRPLCREVINALKSASEDMGNIDTFKGYGPEQGYMFLRSKIKSHYLDLGVKLEENEIFVSDGAKSDVGNILDIFSRDNTVLIPDPVYPVYVDTNVMDGRNIVYVDANESNGFLPLPDEKLNADIIYICSPNNPTGATYDRVQLKIWVDYAIKNDAVILYDAAYEAFIEDDNLPRSIFEIDGSRNCAIEFCSLSKTAGFTGTRCGYTVVPNELKREGLSINKLWLRRQCTKFNGVSYVVQKAAEAVFSSEGQSQIKESIRYYKDNALIISKAVESLGLWFTGGKNSPYIWLKCPKSMSSWEFFDYLLEKCNIVGTPGAGFGKNGEGFFRLSAFGNREKTLEAAERLKRI